LSVAEEEGRCEIEKRRAGNSLYDTLQLSLLQ
jgi:hypothetical protein